MSDFLFGSTPKLDVQRHETLTPEQLALINQVVGIVSQRLDQPIDSSSLELASISGLEELVNTSLGTAREGSTGEAATGTAVGGLSNLDRIFDEDAQDIDEFFTRTIQDPLLEAFSEDILPAIRTRHAPQFFGGERREAEARAVENLIETIGKERARVGFAAEESQRNRQLEASRIAPSAATGAAATPFIGPLTAAGIASTGASIGGAAEQRRLDEMNRRIREALAAVGTPAFENIGAGLPGQIGAVQSFLDSFGSGLGAGAGAAAGG